MHGDSNMKKYNSSLLLLPSLLHIFPHYIVVALNKPQTYV
jgi:hypothetical protein